jgi:NADH-quinone oxidoreductase subunit C
VSIEAQPEQTEAADTRHPAAQALDAALPGALQRTFDQHGQTVLVVERERIREVLTLLRDRPEFQFNMLVDLTAVDYLGMDREPRFNVVYNLLSLAKNSRITIKVEVPEDDEVVPSVTPDWPTANWLEREVYDMMGVRFSGHPDLRRILMPHDWQTYPQRKDVPLGEEPVAFSDNVPPNEPA